MKIPGSFSDLGNRPLPNWDRCRSNRIWATGRGPNVATARDEIARPARSPDRATDGLLQQLTRYRGH